MKYSFVPLILMLAACGDRSIEEKPTAQQQIRSVKYLVTQQQDYQQFREFGGEVKSVTTSPLSFKVSGTIEDIYVTKGEFVEKGQLLAELEKDEFTLALEKAQASLGTASAARYQSLDQYERALKLKEKGFVSDSELLAIQADLDARTQQVNLAKADVNNAKLSLERTSLHAPFTGQLSNVNYDSFTKVSSGNTVMQLISSNAYQVDFLVPESLIHQVKFGESMHVSIPALDGVEINGVIAEIGAVVEKGNAYSVTLTLNDTETQLRNGMSATVILPVGGKNDNVVKLPLNAIDFGDGSQSNSTNQAAIYVINDDLTLSKRYVKVLHSINREVIVLDNLKSGEKVVVAGIPYLYDGQKIALWSGV